MERRSSVNNLPTGTVTFMFTDIEGSTKRWEQYPQAMQTAVERHDIFLRQAIEANSGYAFKTVGGCFLRRVPHRARGAHAVLALQRTLNSAVWDGTRPLKGRIALLCNTSHVVGL